MRASRDGSFLIYVVFATVITIASVGLLYLASFRVRDQEARYDADHVVARYLARGAVEILAYGVELDLERPEPPAVGGRALRDVLALDPKALDAIMRLGADRRADRRDLLELLLGPEPFRRIDSMLALYRGAKLTFKVTAKVTGKPFTGLKDPIEKIVELGLEAHCELGHADDTFGNVLTLVVYSELPWVLSRLAVIWPGARPEEMNRLPVTVQGAAIGGRAPVVVFNAPEDFGADDPMFDGRPRPERSFPPTQLASSVVELEKRLAHRGATYVDAGPDELPLPIALRVASGGPPHGQNFQMFPSQTGETYYPQADRIGAQPPAFEKFHPATPGGTTTQQAWVQGATLGYYEGIDADHLLGPPNPGEDDGDGSSVLRPLGTAVHPSAGLVYGNVRAGLAAMSDLAMDRDDTSADENAQRAAGGREPRQRESIDPFLPNLRQQELETDLALEDAGQPLLRLPPFASPGLPPGQVRNLNASLEPDPALAVLGLDLGQYRYRKLFGGWAEYSRTMSRRLSLPYDTLLAAAARGADGSAAFLREAAFGSLSLEADLRPEAHWTHTDPLHASIEPTAGHRDYLDTTAEGAIHLGELVRKAGEGPRYVRASIECKGEPLFRASFLVGQALDLGGCEVRVVPARSTEPPPRLDLGDLEVVPGGGGILRAAEVSVRSVKNRGAGSTFSPLVVVANRLVLKGAGPYEACFLLQDSLALEGDTNPLTVKGLVFDSRGGLLSSLARPLAVVFDPRLDPTGVDANLHYRSHLLYGAGARISGMGGWLVDSSDYQRPAGRQP